MAAASGGLTMVKKLTLDDLGYIGPPPDVPGTVWVVAQIKAANDEGWATDWELGGVFTTEANARDACTEPTDAMWPVALDEQLGRDTTAPPGITFPASRTEES